MGAVSDADVSRPSGVKLTYDDFLLFPDDGKRHEIIDGEHYVTAAPNTKHQRISMRLSVRLGGFIESRQLGQLFAAPFDVLLSRFDVVEPDLVYVSNARAAEVLTAAHVRGAPDLVAEIGSPSTRKRDETMKRRLYERSDIAEYWAVDPDLDEIRVYRLTDGRFSRVVTLSREQGDILASPLFPGLELSLTDVFAT